jgi:hypothetical protein
MMTHLCLKKKVVTLSLSYLLSCLPQVILLFLSLYFHLLHILILLPLTPYLLQHHCLQQLLPLPMILHYLNLYQTPLIITLSKSHTHCLRQIP